MSVVVVEFVLIFGLICGMSVVNLMVGVAVLFIFSVICVVDVRRFDSAGICGFHWVYDFSYLIGFCDFICCECW